jgi:hypothetical protein
MYRNKNKNKFFDFNKKKSKYESKQSVTIDNVCLFIKNTLDVPLLLEQQNDDITKGDQFDNENLVCSDKKTIVLNNITKLNIVDLEKETSHPSQNLLVNNYSSIWAVKDLFEKQLGYQGKSEDKEQEKEKKKDFDGNSQEEPDEDLDFYILRSDSELEEKQIDFVKEEVLFENYGDNIQIDSNIITEKDELIEYFEDFFEQDLITDKALEYYYDVVRLNLNNENRITFNIFNMTSFKDLMFLEGNNMFRNIFFSDFFFDLNKNLTIEQDTEFNNFVFFSKNKLFQSYNLLNTESLYYKTGFSTRISDPDMYLYANSEVYTHVYSFDFILRYSISFIFCFFIPFFFYSCFELFIILYITFYLFSWSVPESFYEVFVVKIIKFINLIIFGEKNYENIVFLFFNKEPVIFWISERGQFFILMSVVFICWMWFVSYFVFTFFDLFSFFGNIICKYFSLEDDSVVETLDEGQVDDEALDDEIASYEQEPQYNESNFSNKYPYEEEEIPNIIGENHFEYVTPFSLFYSIITDSLLMIFSFLIYDLYLTSIFNTNSFILLKKEFYYFFCLNNSYEVFVVVDFFKKVNLNVYCFFFFPLFFLFLYLYFSTKIFRLISMFSVFFYRIDTSYADKYILKNFSVKLKDSFINFMLAFSPKILKPYFISPIEKQIDTLFLPGFTTVSYVDVYVKKIPKILFYISLFFLSVAVANLLIWICKEIIVFYGIDNKIEINDFILFCRKIHSFFNDVFVFYKGCLLKLFVFFFFSFSFNFLVFQNIIFFLVENKFFFILILDILKICMSIVLIEVESFLLFLFYILQIVFVLFLKNKNLYLFFSFVKYVFYILINILSNFRYFCFFFLEHIPILIEIYKYKLYINSLYFTFFYVIYYLAIFALKLSFLFFINSNIYLFCCLQIVYTYNTYYVLAYSLVKRLFNYGFTFLICYFLFDLYFTILKTNKEYIFRIWLFYQSNYLTPEFIGKLNAKKFHKKLDLKKYVNKVSDDPYNTNLASEILTSKMFRNNNEFTNIEYENKIKEESFRRYLEYKYQQTLDEHEQGVEHIYNVENIYKEENKNKRVVNFYTVEEAVVNFIIKTIEIIEMLLDFFFSILKLIFEPFRFVIYVFIKSRYYFSLNKYFFIFRNLIFNYCLSTTRYFFELFEKQQNKNINDFFFDLFFFVKNAKKMEEEIPIKKREYKYTTYIEGSTEEDHLELTGDRKIESHIFNYYKSLNNYISSLFNVIKQKVDEENKHDFIFFDLTNKLKKKLREKILLSIHRKFQRGEYAGFSSEQRHIEIIVDLYLSLTNHLPSKRKRTYITYNSNVFFRHFYYLNKINNKKKMIEKTFKVSNKKQVVHEFVDAYLKDEELSLRKDLYKDKDKLHILRNENKLLNMEIKQLEKDLSLLLTALKKKEKEALLKKMNLKSETKTDEFEITK